MTSTTLPQHPPLVFRQARVRTEPTDRGGLARAVGAVIDPHLAFWLAIALLTIGLAAASVSMLSRAKQNENASIRSEVKAAAAKEPLVVRLADGRYVMQGTLDDIAKATALARAEQMNLRASELPTSAVVAPVTNR